MSWAPVPRTNTKTVRSWSTRTVSACFCRITIATFGPIISIATREVFTFLIALVIQCAGNIDPAHRIIPAVGEHVITEDTLASGDECVCVDEAAPLGVVKTGLQVIQPGFLGKLLTKILFLPSLLRTIATKYNYKPKDSLPCWLLFHLCL